MKTKYYDLKEFVKIINEEMPGCDEYKFYMETNDEKYEIEPVYNCYDEVEELELKEDSDNIFNICSLTEVTCATFTIEKVEE